MISFDIIFNCIYLSVLGYQVLYFLVQYSVLKRVELLYYSMFLLLLAIYYVIYMFVPLLHNQQRQFEKQPFSSLEAIFLVLVNMLYLKFLQNYLDLRITKSKLFQLTKYYVWLNWLLTFVFLSIFIIKIKSESILMIASLLTMPFSIAILFMM